MAPCADLGSSVVGCLPARLTAQEDVVPERPGGTRQIRLLMGICAHIDGDLRSVRHSSEADCHHMEGFAEKVVGSDGSQPGTLCKGAWTTCGGSYE
jgi:hypothetical protein